MYETRIEDFNIRMIAESGQCFRMNQIDQNTYSVVMKDHYTEITQNEEEAKVLFSCPEEEARRIWLPYFDIDFPYGKIKEQADEQDEFLNNAIQYGAGIRILNQDLWEMIISFLISQNNNIKRIKNSIEELCRRYGKKCISGEGKEYYAFPRPEELAKADLETLHDLGLGYRDKYILVMARRCSGAEGEAWLESLKEMEYEAAAAVLVKEYGIGRKVADCICLFGLHHVDAFPIDTHVKQILAKWYPDGFPFERYKGFAGIVQQYMFYYKLHISQKNKG